MRSLSTLAPYTLANLGPLTTPFTAAPSCTTAPGPSHLVGHLPSGGIAQAECPDTVGTAYFEGCWPSASRARSLADALLTARVQTLTGDGSGTRTVSATFAPLLAPYFSPGVRCPDGWTTAGTLAWPEDTATMTSGAARLPEVSGVFDEGDYNATGPEWDRPRVYGVDQAMARALEPGETLAFCCPRNWQGYRYGFCASELGPAADHGFTEVCWFDDDRRTLTPVAVTDGPFYSTETESLTAYTITNAMPLVYRASDMAAATATGTPNPTGTDAADPTGTDAGGEGGEATPTSNAGPRNAPSEGVPLVVVATALFALVGGMGVVWM